MTSHNISRLPIHADLSSSLFAPSNQPPLIPSVPTVQQLKIPQLTPFNSQKLAQRTNPYAFDSTIQPTKRIRHEQCDYADCLPREKEISRFPEIDERTGFLRHNEVVSNPQLEIPSFSFNFEDRLGLASSSKIIADKKGERMGSPPEWVKANARFGLNGNRLIVPGLKELSHNSGKIDDATELLQEQLLRQLEYHRTQQAVIEQMLWQLEAKQHNEQLYMMQQIQQPDYMLRYLHESTQQICAFPNRIPDFGIKQKIKVKNNHSLFSEPMTHKEDNPQLKFQDNDQYAKLERSTNEKTSDEGQHSNDGYESLFQNLENEPKTETLAQAPLKEPRQEVKKRRNYNYPVNYFGILGKNLIGKAKEEPRRKNKWQQLAGGDEPETHNREKSVPLVKESTEIEKQEDEPVREKIIPYIEDESNIDYNYLLSIKITNDPITLGYENPTQGFVVVSGGNEKYDENKDESETKETRVGNKYQAVIPELQDSSLRLNHRRKFPDLLWNPKILTQLELESYFKDLCKILNCERINEERALRLLKRKNYKKERVKVNISKNEKFYSSFLVVDMTRKDEQNISE